MDFNLSNCFLIYFCLNLNMKTVPLGSKNILSWEFNKYKLTRYFIYIPISKNPFKNFTRIKAVGNAKAVIFKNMTIRFYRLSWKGLKTLKKEVYQTKTVSLNDVEIMQDGIRSHNLTSSLHYLLKNKEFRSLVSVPNRNNFFIGFKTLRKNFLKSRIVLHLKMPSIRQSINLNSKSWNK